MAAAPRCHVCLSRGGLHCLPCPSPAVTAQTCSGGSSSSSSVPRRPHFCRKLLFGIKLTLNSSTFGPSLILPSFHLTGRWVRSGTLPSVSRGRREA